MYTNTVMLCTPGPTSQRRIEALASEFGGREDAVFSLRRNKREGKGYWLIGRDDIVPKTLPYVFGGPESG